MTSGSRRAMNTLPAREGSEIRKEVHTMEFDFDKTYWNGCGAEQKKYDEMQAAEWEFNITTDNTFYRYYRFYNDGDASTRITGLLRHSSPEALKSNPEYIDYCRHLEEAVTWRILIEYKRFKRAQRNPA